MRLIQFFEAGKRYDFWDMVAHYDLQHEAETIGDLALPWINDNRPGKISSMARNPKYRLLSQIKLFMKMAGVTNYSKKFMTPKKFEAALNQPVTVWRGGGGEYDPDYPTTRSWSSFTADERRVKTFSQYDGTYGTSGLPGQRLSQRSDSWEIELTLPLKDILLYLPNGYDDEVIISNKDAKRAQVVESQLTEATNPDVKVKRNKHGIYNAYLKGRRVGQAQVYDYESDGMADNERYIWKASVDPAYHRQGVATEMYNVIADDLASQGLKLVPSPDQQLSGDAYQFWKARDPESIKQHGTYKAENLQHLVGRELELRGRPVVVRHVGWSKNADAPLLGVRYTDVPEGSSNSTSTIRWDDAKDQLGESEGIELPDLDVGDELMVGKFKNRKATIKGFKKDKHNQPIAKTNKGDQQIFKGRVKKLMDEVELNENESFDRTTTEMPDTGLTQLIEVLNTRAVFEYNLMEKFAQSDVDNVSWFWAHPASGGIYHIPPMSSHTISALEPDGPIGLSLDDFGGRKEVSLDDQRVFEAAFRRGWVRSSYIPDNGSPLGAQVGLHGPDEETVRLTLQMLLDKGLQVDHVGMRGHYDGFEYDEPHV